MRAVLVIIGIVIILALISLPGAAMISKADLIASYPPSHDRASMMDWLRGPVHCGNCTPESWSEGTIMPTPTPVAMVLPVENYGDPLDPYTVPVPILPCIGGHCPESLSLTWYNKVAFRILSF